MSFRGTGVSGLGRVGVKGCTAEGYAHGARGSQGGRVGGGGRSTNHSSQLDAKGHLGSCCLKVTSPRIAFNYSLRKDARTNSNRSTLCLLPKLCAKPPGPIVLRTPTLDLHDDSSRVQSSHSHTTRLECI